MAAPVFGQKVIVITEPLTYTTIDLRSVIQGGPLWVDHVRWHSMASGADAAITDRDGKPVATLKAQAANQDILITFSEGARHWRHGFKVPVLSSGTLEVHIA